MKTLPISSPWMLWAIPLSFVLLGILMLAIRFVRLRRRPKQDPEQMLLGAVSASLQERGQLAASLGELRTVHERILDALPFGLLWVDQRQQMAALNARGTELLGVKRGVVGLDASFVLEPFPWLLSGLAEVPGEVWRCEGGGRRWELRRIEAPNKIGALLQFEDVTEQEADERRRALRERFAELGEMTAGVAHQLKNGLAVLKGHGQLLARAGHTAVARELLDETESLERLVQRFLQWAKPLDPQCAELDLAEAVHQAILEIQRRPASRGTRFESEGQGMAMADSLLLHQALVNLLENASQAMVGAGRVTVQVQDNAIRIEDEGPGFGEDTLIRMLRPFESGRPEGTGLGLPLALKWLNAQGADLRIEPREDVGTRVRITW
jgi:signal transduction histidine kinase